MSVQAEHGATCICNDCLADAFIPDDSHIGDYESADGHDDMCAALCYTPACTSPHGCSRCPDGELSFDEYQAKHPDPRAE